MTSLFVPYSNNKVPVHPVRSIDINPPDRRIIFLPSCKEIRGVQVDKR